jgi:hypothetical protein
MTLAAYSRSTLPRLGYTYERAMNVPHIAAALSHTVKHTVHRTNDTICCSCGKQWDLTDTTPESCKP